jgi:hypothetical protein
MKIFSAFIQFFVRGVMDLKSKHFDETGASEEKNNIVRKLKFCYRCKIEKDDLTYYCLDCKKVAYCSIKCKKRNKRVHDILCLTTLDNFSIIKTVVKEMDENYEFLKGTEQRQNLKKKK